MNHKNISPIPKSRGDLFIRVHNMIKCEKLDIWLNRRSPALIKVVQKCLGHILEHEELNGAALKYVDNFCKQAPYFYEKSKSRIMAMFLARKTYFDAMIPIETMNAVKIRGRYLKPLVEINPVPTPNKIVLENDNPSKISNVTVENEMEFPVESTVEYPVESPLKSPFKFPVDSTVESPVDSPFESPIESPVESSHDYVADDSERCDATLDDPDLDLSEEFLETILKQVDELCDNIKNSDYDIDRALRVNQKLTSAVNCYRNILELRKEIIDETDVQEFENHDTEETQEIIAETEIQEFENNDSKEIQEVVTESNVQELVNHDTKEILQLYHCDDQNENINQPIKTDELIKFVKNQCGNHTVVSMAKTLKVPNSLLAQWVIGNKISILESADKKIITKNQDDCHFCEVDIIDSQIVSYLKFDNELDMFQCSICNERKIKRCNMIRHIKENHISEMTSNSNSNTNFSKIIDCGNLSCKKVYGAIKQRKKFWCEQCTAIFKVSSAIKKRKSNKRQKKRIKIKELCPECGKSVSDLKNHLNVVHYVEKQTCSQCGKVLQSVIALKSHIKEIHEKVPCTECGKLYGSSTMTRHIHSAHTPNDQKKFKCEVCDKGFSESHRLKDHMNIHTGEKPYKCKYCANCFANRGNQRMHERGHEGYRRNYSKKTQTFQN